jgi:DNA-binding NtrC family response regulator
VATRPPISVLILDDEAHVREILADYLLDVGDFDVRTAGTNAEAFDALDSAPVDVCLVDLRLQDGEGFAFIRKASPRHPSVRFLIHTGSRVADVRERARAVGLGEDRILPKPLGLDAVAAAIVRAVSS